MFRSRIVCCLFFGCSMACFGSIAEAQVSPLLQAYPCGPDGLTGPLRKLIPQGAFGADFRPACRAHDACYDTPYSNRSQCDQQFLQNMLSACSQSTHPILCRMTATTLYKVTRRRGQKSFESAQRIAIDGVRKVRS